MWTPRVLTCFNCKVILVQILDHRLVSERTVPRLFPPPVFDRLQYAETDLEGEGLGERVTCMTSGRREEGGARSFCNSQTLH